jgi:iron complex outermembrane receptor protein
LLTIKAEETITIPSTEVNSHLIGVSSDEMADPSYILNGRELSIKRESSLGETLTLIPGVSNSSYGPSVGRPVIRGMDGDHIQILQNGLSNLDVSNLSADHGVSIDPLIVEQIELIRGPSSLLYGNGITGGVVNAIDHRIPKDALIGITGRGESRYDTADHGQSNAAIVDVGSGSFVIHMDAYNRNTGNLMIPNYAVSQIKNSNDSSHGKGSLTNSDSSTYGGAIGASMIFDRGYAGFSYSNHNTNYGSPAENTVRLKMDANLWNFASEIKDIDYFFNRIKVRLSNTDYQHSEIDNGAIQTTFKNSGTEGSFEIGHKPFQKLEGIFGFSFSDSQFKSIGSESFAPNSNTSSQSYYLLEELPLFDKHKLVGALRVANHQINSTFDNKNYFTNNLSLGYENNLSDNWLFKTNLNHSERAPTYYELFASGIHSATGQYVLGNTQLNNETSNGIEFNLKYKNEKDLFSVSTYYTKFNRYIGLFNTGSSRDVNSHTFYDADFKSIPAVFKGIELENKRNILENLTLNLKAEYLEAKNDLTNEYLPRIAPVKIGIGSTYQKGGYSLNINVLRAFAQNKIAQNELKTNGYTNLSALVSYQLPTSYNIELFARANNLLNEDIRDHTSFIKDIAPQAGRSVLFGLRGDF